MKDLGGMGGGRRLYFNNSDVYKYTNIFCGYKRPGTDFLCTLNSITDTLNTHLTNAMYIYLFKINNKNLSK